MCARPAGASPVSAPVVDDISLPAHAQGLAIWAAIRGDAACVTLLEMNGAGINHEGLYVTSLHGQGDGLARAAPIDFADTIKIASIFSKYTARPLWRPLLRQGAEYPAAAARRVRCGTRRARPSVAADGTDEGDADSEEGRVAAGNHTAQLGGAAQHLSDSTSPATRRSACRAGWRTVARSA